jgi:molybdate transport system substrate-binding protein
VSRDARREATVGAPSRWLWLLLLVAPGPIVAADLWVSVAVSFEPAVAEIVQSRFGGDSQLTIHLNGGGSALLMQQALRGAPADLFISASPVELDRLETAGLLLPGSRRIVAANTLVVAVPRGADPPPSPEGLAAPSYRLVAVGNPRTAPLGRYTAEALAALGVDDALATRLVPGENARQVLDWVARGEVDAGIVYASDARLFAARLRTGPEFPASSHHPVRYEAAIMAATTDPEAARTLLEALLTDGGTATLRRYGFRPPS